MLASPQRRIARAKPALEGGCSEHAAVPGGRSRGYLRGYLVVLGEARTGVAEFVERRSRPMSDEYDEFLMMRSIWLR
jgi:hypothetical protein